MTELIKNICMTPINFGLQQFNYLAAQGLLVIFNLYGKRLLQIEDDLFIKSCECIHNYNCYRLHPLILNKMEQDVSLSTIKLIKGVIMNAEVKVPWKALLSDYTLVLVEKIDLVIDIVENRKSIHIKSLNQTVPYFSEFTDVKPNQEITEIFAGIREILKKYFNFVSAEIKHISINIGHLTFYLEELKYLKGATTLKSLKILNQELLTYATEVVFNQDLMQLSIDTIYVDSRLIEYLPTIYLNDTPSKNTLNIKIRELKYDKLEAHKIDITIRPNEITLNNLIHLIIPQILIVKFNNLNQDHHNMLDINLEQSTCFMYQPIHLNIMDITQLGVWIKNLQQNVTNFMTKIKITKSDKPNPSNNFIVSNLLLKLVLDNMTFDFFTNKLERGLLDVTLENMKILYSDLILNAPKCEIVHSDSVTSIRLSNPCLKSDNKTTELYSKTLCVGLTTSQILIDLDEANTRNIIEVVNKIKILVESLQQISNSSRVLYEQSDTRTSLFVTALENTNYVEEISDPITDSICDNDPKQPLTNKNTKSRQTILRVSNSNIFGLLEHINTDVVIHIIQGTLNINEMIASDIHSKILLNNQVILNIIAESISRKDINIKTSNLFVDPKIIEICKRVTNYLLSFPFETRETHDTQCIPKLVSESVPFQQLHNLSQQLIEDYRNNSPKQSYDISVKINQLNVYLYNKLGTTTDLHNSNFVNMSFKNMHYVKSSNKDTKDNSLTKHELGIGDIVIIDLRTKNPEWKYIVKSQVESKFLELIYKTSISDSNKSTRIVAFITPVTISLREETVFEFLNFFKPTEPINQSKKNNLDKPNTPTDIIENCYVYPLDIILNYNPVIAGTSPDTDIFSIHNYRIKLPTQSICNAANFLVLSQIIIDNIKKKVNPDNIIQFIPNVKIIQPYTSPVIRLLKIVTHYMHNVNSHKKVNKLTKKISKGYSFAQSMMKMGIKNIWQLFN